jgi:hypothetical protein
MKDFSENNNENNNENNGKKIKTLFKKSLNKLECFDYETSINFGTNVISQQRHYGSRYYSGLVTLNQNLFKEQISIEENYKKFQNKSQINQNYEKIKFNLVENLFQKRINFDHKHDDYLKLYSISPHSTTATAAISTAMLSHHDSDDSDAFYDPGQISDTLFTSPLQSTTSLNSSLTSPESTINPIPISTIDNDIETSDEYFRSNFDQNEQSEENNGQNLNENLADFSLEEQRAQFEELLNGQIEGIFDLDTGMRLGDDTDWSDEDYDEDWGDGDGDDDDDDEDIDGGNDFIIFEQNLQNGENFDNLQNQNENNFFDENNQDNFEFFDDFINSENDSDVDSDDESKHRPVDKYGPTAEIGMYSDVNPFQFIIQRDEKDKSSFKNQQIGNQNEDQNFNTNRMIGYSIDAIMLNNTPMPYPTTTSLTKPALPSAFYYNLLKKQHKNNINSPQNGLKKVSFFLDFCLWLSHFYRQPIRVPVHTDFDIYSVRNNVKPVILSKNYTFFPLDSTYQTELTNTYKTQTQPTETTPFYLWLDELIVGIGPTLRKKLIHLRLLQRFFWNFYHFEKKNKSFTQMTQKSQNSQGNKCVQIIEPIGGQDVVIGDNFCTQGDLGPKCVKSDEKCVKNQFDGYSYKNYTFTQPEIYSALPSTFSSILSRYNKSNVYHGENNNDHNNSQNNSEKIINLKTTDISTVIKPFIYSPSTISRTQAMLAVSDKLFDPYHAHAIPLTEGLLSIKCERLKNEEKVNFKNNNPQNNNPQNIRLNYESHPIPLSTSTYYSPIVSTPTITLRPTDNGSNLSSLENILHTTNSSHHLSQESLLNITTIEHSGSINGATLMSSVPIMTSCGHVVHGKCFRPKRGPKYQRPKPFVLEQREDILDSFADDIYWLVMYGTPLVDGVEGVSNGFEKFVEGFEGKNGKKINNNYVFEHMFFYGVINRGLINNNGCSVPDDYMDLLKDISLLEIDNDDNNKNNNKNNKKTDQKLFKKLIFNFSSLEKFFTCIDPYYNCPTDIVIDTVSECPLCRGFSNAFIPLPYLRHKFHSNNKSRWKECQKCVQKMDEQNHEKINLEYQNSFYCIYHDSDSDSDNDDDGNNNDNNNYDYDMADFEYDIIKYNQKNVLLNLSKQEISLENFKNSPQIENFSKILTAFQSEYSIIPPTLLPRVPISLSKIISNCVANGINDLRRGVSSVHQNLLAIALSQSFSAKRYTFPIKNTLKSIFTQLEDMVLNSSKQWLYTTLNKAGVMEGRGGVAMIENFLMNNNKNEQNKMVKNNDEKMSNLFSPLYPTSLITTIAHLARQTAISQPMPFDGAGFLNYTLLPTMNYTNKPLNKNSFFSSNDNFGTDLNEKIMQKINVFDNLSSPPVFSPVILSDIYALIHLLSGTITFMEHSVRQHHLPQDSNKPMSSNNSPKTPKIEFTDAKFDKKSKQVEMEQIPNPSLLPQYPLSLSSHPLKTASTDTQTSSAIVTVVDSIPCRFIEANGVLFGATQAFIHSHLNTPVDSSYFTVLSKLLASSWGRVLASITPVGGENSAICVQRDEQGEKSEEKNTDIFADPYTAFNQGYMSETITPLPLSTNMLHVGVMACLSHIAPFTTVEECGETMEDKMQTINQNDEQNDDNNQVIIDSNIDSLVNEDIIHKYNILTNPDNINNPKNINVIKNSTTKTNFIQENRFILNELLNLHNIQILSQILFSNFHSPHLFDIISLINDEQLTVRDSILLDGDYTPCCAVCGYNDWSILDKNGFEIDQNGTKIYQNEQHFDNFDQTDGRSIRCNICAGFETVLCDLNMSLSQHAPFIGKKSLYSDRLSNYLSQSQNNTNDEKDDKSTTTLPSSPSSPSSPSNQNKKFTTTPSCCSNSHMGTYKTAPRHVQFDPDCFATNINNFLFNSQYNINPHITKSSQSLTSLTSTLSNNNNNNNSMNDDYGDDFCDLFVLNTSQCVYISYILLALPLFRQFALLFSISQGSLLSTLHDNRQYVPYPLDTILIDPDEWNFDGGNGEKNKTKIGQILGQIDTIRNTKLWYSHMDLPRQYGLIIDQTAQSGVMKSPVHGWTKYLDEYRLLAQLFGGFDILIPVFDSKFDSKFDTILPPPKTTIGTLASTWLHRIDTYLYTQHLMRISLTPQQYHGLLLTSFNLDQIFSHSITLFKETQLSPISLVNYLLQITSKTSTLYRSLSLFPVIRPPSLIQLPKSYADLCVSYNSTILTLCPLCRNSASHFIYVCLCCGELLFTTNVKMSVCCSKYIEAYGKMEAQACAREMNLMAKMYQNNQRVEGLLKFNFEQIKSEINQSQNIEDFFNNFPNENDGKNSIENVDTSTLLEELYTTLPIHGSIPAAISTYNAHNYSGASPSSSTAITSSSSTKTATKPAPTTPTQRRSTQTTAATQSSTIPVHLIGHNGNNGNNNNNNNDGATTSATTTTTTTTTSQPINTINTMSNVVYNNNLYNTINASHSHSASMPSSHHPLLNQFFAQQASHASLLSASILNQHAIICNGGSRRPFGCFLKLQTCEVIISYQNLIKKIPSPYVDQYNERHYVLSSRANSHGLRAVDGMLFLDLNLYKEVCEVYFGLHSTHTHSFTLGAIGAGAGGMGE